MTFLLSNVCKSYCFIMYLNYKHARIHRCISFKHKKPNESRQCLVMIVARVFTNRNQRGKDNELTATKRQSQRLKGQKKTQQKTETQGTAQKIQKFYVSSSSNKTRLQMSLIRGPISYRQESYERVRTNSVARTARLCSTSTRCAPYKRK